MKFFCIPKSLFACKTSVVDQLDFSQLRLEHVPREILKARKHIEELLLNVNSIEELPPDLFRCTKIRRLDVSENKIKVIPPEIGILQALEELNLSKNEIVEIPEEIGLCQNLAILDISTNIVTGFPKSFVNLSQLASLNLSNNSLTQLPQDIDRLYNLQFLDIAQCELRFLPASIVRLERLKVLDLCDNYLTELPADMHGMVSLEMLDLHCNMISRLPEELLRCRSLRTLDLSGNQLSELPQNMGDLQQLVELVLCENQIRKLPHTIGHLKRLEVLKASKNCLMELTPAICTCFQLTDLILCENQLSELPASLGNLRRLRFLDVNVNNLHSIPTTIGNCQSLGVLTLRHNQLEELPMEIGKLNQLQVLDVADNNLKYLPYTLTVLYQSKTLAALWLSFNQPPLPKLTTTNEPIMNIKVLTCYLLPQKEAQPVRRSGSKSCVGGAKVCFAGDRNMDEEEDKVPIGRFERYDTPHPKPFAPKNRHNRNSGDFTGIVGAAPAAAVGSARSEKFEASLPDQMVAEQSRPLRSVLKRRPQSVVSHISQSELNALLDGSENGKAVKKIRKNIQLKKHPECGIQWTVVGGADSIPYKGKSGIFISNIVPGGVADRAGFCVDDQLLAVNGQDMRGLGHNDAIELIQRSGEQLEFLVEREQLEQLPGEGTKMIRPTPENCADLEDAQKLPERLSFLIVRNGSGSAGFSVSGTGKWPEDPFTVAAISTSTECPLKPGDRIISVGCANLKFGARLDQVKTLLAGMPGTRVEIVVERGGQWPPPPPKPLNLPARYGYGPSVCSSAFSELTLSRSLPSLLANMPQSGANVAQAEQQHVPKQSTQVTAESKVLSPPSSNQRMFQRQASLVRPSAIGPIPPPLPTPRHHRSMSSLIGGAESNGITEEMLRASTPIEYPPGEEPPQIVGQQKQIESPKVISPSRLPQPASTSFSIENTRKPMASSTTVSPPPVPPKAPMNSAAPSGIPKAKTQIPAKSPLSPPTSMAPLRMDFGRLLMNNNNNGRMESPPLASSSPIFGRPQQQTMTETTSSRMEKSTTSIGKSQIPVLSGTSSTSSSTGNKIPPPVAPKPNAPSGTEPNTVELQQSPSSTAPTTFSSKLKLFEQLQTTSSTTTNSNGTKVNGMNNGTNGGTHNYVNAQQMGAKPSGIPLKKPLVSAQDMEKLREAELESRRRMEQQKADEEDDEAEIDEHRDTVRELSRLIEQQNEGSPGPSIIRTKKAELRAERANTSMDNGSEDGGSLSRASSSLSQRAAEIEKRREWRQARLQSMDVESKRTDDLVKLIAGAAAASAATSAATARQTSTPSPIPIGH